MLIMNQSGTRLSEVKTLVIKKRIAEKAKEGDTRHEHIGYTYLGHRGSDYDVVGYAIMTDEDWVEAEFSSLAEARKNLKEALESLHANGFMDFSHSKREGDNERK